MSDATLAFIGGGNMGRSLVGGLIADGTDPASICVVDPDPGTQAALSKQFGVRVAGEGGAAAGAATLVLAVKPQVMREVAQGLAPAVQRRRPLVVSIAAGVREPDLNRWLGGGVTVVRAMPNTPALVGTGATALYANDLATTEERDRAETILRAVGLTVWVSSESLLDAVTAVSGSGPAYFFLLMEAMEQAGQALGLAPADARLLTVQTALGAARMALESEEGPAELRARVTSPGGTTERAIGVLQGAGLESIVRDALTAARDRARALGAELGGRA